MAPRPLNVAPAGPVSLPETGLGRGWEPGVLMGVTLILFTFGLVTLYGTVRHDLDRELLLTFIEQIKGVQSVVDNLQLVDRPFREPQVPVS